MIDSHLLKELIDFEPLSQIMVTLAVLLCSVIACFSSRYIVNQKARRQFMCWLALLAASLSLFFLAAHAVVFVAALALTQCVLLRLMRFPADWPAARAASRYTFQHWCYVLLLLGLAMGGLMWHAGTDRIDMLLQLREQASGMAWAVCAIMFAAMFQSAIWPGHRWLLSSLNSPTQVCALMHAGVVNGGGFILVRFAPLCVLFPHLLQMVFVFGLITAILGTFWKLMQSDVKRLLACSTMAQMGYMMMQCGLGLFPVAIAHSCWHGLFKAYLFLASPSCVFEQPRWSNGDVKALNFLLAVPCGMAAAMAFAYAGHFSLHAGDTTVLLIGMAMLAGMQSTIAILGDRPMARLFMALTMVSAGGGVYGFTVHLLEQYLAPMHIMHPQPLSPVYVVGWVALCLGWVVMLRVRDMNRPWQPKQWWLRFYVYALNRSQPHRSSITSQRQGYRYE